MADTIDYCSKLIDTNIEPNCQDMAKGFEKSGVIVNMGGYRLEHCEV